MTILVRPMSYQISRICCVLNDFVFGSEYDTSLDTFSIWSVVALFVRSTRLAVLCDDQVGNSDHSLEYIYVHRLGCHRQEAGRWSDKHLILIPKQRSYTKGPRVSKHRADCSHMVHGDMGNAGVVNIESAVLP